MLPTRPYSSAMLFLAQETKETTISAAVCLPCSVWQLVFILFMKAFMTCPLSKGPDLREEYKKTF